MTPNFGDGDVGGVDMHVYLRYKAPRINVNYATASKSQVIPSSKMFRTSVLRTAEQTLPYIYTNAFKAKRLWPPDFTKLSTKQQFRLEQKYKRRTKLKWARPRWVKGVKLVQMASITCRC